MWSTYTCTLRSRYIWWAIQHGAEYYEDGTCAAWQYRELNSLPALLATNKQCPNCASTMMMQRQGDIEDKYRY